jgi:serine/threonine protein kinase
LGLVQGLRILQGIASAAAHLHAQGVAHGDLYAHNILYETEGHALLGDFGAASIYRDVAVEKLEVLALAHLMEDVQNLIELSPDEAKSPSTVFLMESLTQLRKSCAAPRVSERPSFAHIETTCADLFSETIV